MSFPAIQSWKSLTPRRISKWILGFRSILKIAEKVLRKSFVPGNWEKRLWRSLPWREILHLSHATSYLLPATHNLSKICRIKNKQGSFPGRTPVTGVITPLNYFVNSICSPSIAQRR